MRNRIWIMAAMTFIALGLSGGLVWAAEEEMCVPMGAIDLEPLSSQAKRAAVTFPHAVHFSYNCQQCHHKWDNKTVISGCSAKECHDIAEAPKDKDGKPDKDELKQIRYFKNAYHTMCIGCHKEIKQQNMSIAASQMPGKAKLIKTGPTGCIQCHPDEE